MWLPSINENDVVGIEMDGTPPQKLDLLRTLNLFCDAFVAVTSLSLWKESTLLTQTVGCVANCNFSTSLVFLQIKHSLDLFLLSLYLSYSGLHTTYAAFNKQSFYWIACLSWVHQWLQPLHYLHRLTFYSFGFHATYSVPSNPWTRSWVPHYMCCF